MEAAKTTLQEPQIRARLKIKKAKKPRARAAAPTAARRAPAKKRELPAEAPVRWRPARNGSFAVRVSLDAESVFLAPAKSAIVLAPIGRRQYPRRMADGRSVPPPPEFDSDSDGLGEFVSTNDEWESEEEVADDSSDDEKKSDATTTTTGSAGTDPTAAAAGGGDGLAATTDENGKRKRETDGTAPTPSNKRVRPNAEPAVTGTSRVPNHAASAPASSEQRRANKLRLKLAVTKRREYKRKRHNEREKRLALKAVRRDAIEASADRKPTKAAAARAAKRKALAEANPLTPQQVDELLLEFGFLYRKADDSPPEPISRAALAAGIPPPKHYRTGELVPVNWCRYCGARATARWQSGPWGPKTLCTTHHSDSVIKKSLDLSPWSTFQPTAPIGIHFIPSAPIPFHSIPSHPTSPNLHSLTLCLLLL